jgi:hypothetical protein
MNKLRQSSALVAALALSGCTLARPLIDREMAKAPNAACAAVNGEHPLLMRARAGVPAEQVEAGAPSQCFALFEEQDGRRQAWSGGALQPGRTLIAVHDAADADCKGRFTHFNVAGGSAGAGELELETWDVAARPGHMRRHRWERGFGQRNFGLASIDHPTMAPAGVRIRVLTGSFDPANICFKSY